MSAPLQDPLVDNEIVVQGYCVHCRTRRLMHGAIQVCNRRGRHDLKGHCAVCGRSMYRLGGWDSVVAATQEPRTGEQKPNSPGTFGPDGVS